MGLTQAVPRRSGQGGQAPAGLFPSLRVTFPAGVPPFPSSRLSRKGSFDTPLSQQLWKTRSSFKCPRWCGRTRGSGNTQRQCASAARQGHFLGLHHSVLPLRLLWKPFSSGLFQCPKPCQHCLLQNPCHPPPCKCSGKHSLQLFRGIRDPFHELGHLAVLGKSQSEIQTKILWKKLLLLCPQTSIPRTCQYSTYWPGSASWALAGKEG